MASPFSEGLVSGFSVIETMRDRREARANEARRISLAEAANARANDLFRISEEERARGHAREARTERTLSARARALRDPDNVSDEDLMILEQGGDAETIAMLEGYGDRRAFTTASLRDLASRAAQTGAPGSSVTQSPGGRPAQFSPQEEAFLSPSEDSELAPDQFPQPRSLPLEDVMDYLPPDDPAFRRGRARATFGLDLTTPEGRAEHRARGRRTGAAVQVPPGVLSASEIDALPIVEQEAARARNRELLGNRIGQAEDVRAAAGTRTTAGAYAKGREALSAQYQGMLDSREDSPIRQLAATQPTAWIAQYARDRNSLDENTRALVDRRVYEIAQQSLANLRQQSRNVPIVNGAPDFSSPEGQALKRGIEQNIAVLSAAERDFSAADAAQIRGGYMPVGNRQLTERVTNAWQEQPPPARPATAAEERLLRTDLNRLDAATGTRKISSATIDRLGKAVARGWIDYKDAESILLTGRVPQAAMQFHTADPKNDVFINGRLVRRGYDAEAAREARDKMQEEQREFIENQFELLYPGDEDWQREERGRRMGQFYTQQYQQRAAILERHGFDPLNTDIPHTAALVNAFAATDKADNEWDKGLLGTRRWLYGPLEDQAEYASDESLQLTRDLLPDQYGVFSLGNVQFRAELARQRLLETGNPADRAAVIATEGNDAALLEYMRESYPEAFPGGAPQE